LRSPTIKIGSLYPTTQSRVSDKSPKNADETDAEPGRYITTTVDFPDTTTSDKQVTVTKTKMNGIS